MPKARMGRSRDDCAHENFSVQGERQDTHAVCDFEYRYANQANFCSLSAGYGQSGQERQLYQGGRVSPGYEDIYDQYAGGGGAPYMTAEDDKSLYSKTSHVYERDGMYYNNVATESPSRPRHEAIEMSPYRPGGAFGAPPPMGGYGTPQPAPGSPWAGALGPPGAYLATSTPGMGRATRDGPGGYRQTRERLMRKRTVKHVELTNGNLVSMSYRSDWMIRSMTNFSF